MGWFEDACAWVETAVEDVGEAFDAAGDAIEQAATEVIDWVGDTVEDVAEAVVATVTGAVDTLVDFGEAVGDTFSGRDPVETWNEFGMNALDNMVFDPVDYLTGGDVNLDYEDGTFTADVDLNLGIGAVGLHVGESGFDASASFDVGIASGSISLDSSAGFAATGSIGIADGPWPYAEGHLSITPEGEVMIGGELQGSLPIPGGYIGGGISGELVRNEDGSWGASGSLDAEFDGPMDTGGYLHADGSATLDPGDMELGFDANVAAGLSGPRGAHVDAQAGIDAEFDDMRLDTTVEAGVEAGLAGVEFDTGGAVGVGVGLGGPSLAVDGWADLDVPDVSSGAASTGPGAAGVGAGAGAASSGAALDGGAGTAPAFDDPFAARNDPGASKLGGADDASGGFAEAPPVDTSMDAPMDAQVEIDAPPEPDPVDDFSQQLQATDQIEEQADDMWDGLGQ